MILAARRAAPPVFALTLFASAALTFSLQPLFGRMVTPLLGGSPAVWNTSMAFFQAALLAGYLYAHLLQRVRVLRVQILVHALALAAAWLTLPLHVSGVFGPPNVEQPALWLLGVLTLSVGAPFAIASASAPLLQAWYARTGRADAHDPYYLYAASNLGSFAGLLAYPIVVEPLIGLSEQRAVWTIAYLAVAVFIALAALVALGANRGAGAESAASVSPAPTWKQRLYWLAAAAIPSSLILGVTQHISTDVASAPFLWVLPLALYLLTFVIAFARGAERIAPFVLIAHPLALALLVSSYFSRTGFGLTLAANLACFFLSALVCHLALARARPPADRLTEFYLWVSIGGVVGGAATALLAPLIFNDIYEYPLALAAIALFRPIAPIALKPLANATAAASFAMALAALALFVRNPIELALFAGGAGGAAAIIGAAAPIYRGAGRRMQMVFLATAMVFALAMTATLMKPDWLFSQEGADGAMLAAGQAPLGLGLMGLALILLTFVVQGLLRPRASGESLLSEAALGVALPCLTLVLFMLLSQRRFDNGLIVMVGLSFAAIALLLNRGRPRLLAGLVLTAFAIVFFVDRTGGRIIAQERSFFGVLRTEEFADDSDPTAPILKVLMHGSTIHGAQLSGLPEIERRPLTYYNPGTSLGEATLAGLSLREQNRLALIGLGAGATACLTRPTDALTIYEIDPAVVRLATSAQGEFTYVNACQPDARIVLGDARLKIAEEPDGAFDVIVVDAFSSDAVPAHLLTREAVAMYLRKTSARGIVVLHLSNRNLALVAEAVRVAGALNAPFLWRVSDRVPDAQAGPYGGLPASAMVLARDPATLASLPFQSDEWRTLPLPPGRAWSDEYINLPRALLQSLNGFEDCLQNEAKLECE